MACELVPVEFWHIAHVAANARDADVREVWASSRSSPLETLERGVRSALVCWTGLVDGEPVAVFGASPASLLTGIGIPWMIATPRLHDVQRPFLRLSRPVVELMQSHFPLLVNAVDNRNAATIRWLRKLGFEVQPPRPEGPDGHLFCRFVRRRHV